MYKDLFNDPAVAGLLIRSGDRDPKIAEAAQYQLAQALQQPLRDGVMSGDNLNGIFEQITFAPGAAVEFPLSFLSPGEEVNFVAYANPGHGYIPEKQVSGDYVTLPTYSIANAIDWLLKYARDARWDIVTKCLNVLDMGFTKKMNDDGWHTILSAAVDRNIVVYDADANAGQFSKRLVSLMTSIMRRNAGGNTGSMNRGKLTDIYLSVEGKEDMRNWGIDQVDDFTRRQIYISEDGAETKVFGVYIHDMDEFGVSQEYQNFFVNTLGGALASGDLELVIGLDLENADSFVMPIREEVSVYPDPALHRKQKAGYYGWGEFGFGVLDNRRVIAGSY